MFDVQSLFAEQYPAFANKHRKTSSLIVHLLRKLWQEERFKSFACEHQGKGHKAILQACFSHINFQFHMQTDVLKDIPKDKGVILVSNHPTGVLDGLGLLLGLMEARGDSRLVLNQVLAKALGIPDICFDVDNISGAIRKSVYKDMQAHLLAHNAMVIFPAGEVARLKGYTIKEKDWQSSFVRLAKSTSSVVLPVYIDGRNSNFFYFLSAFAKPLSRLWVMPELFKLEGQQLNATFGAPIQASQLNAWGEGDDASCAQAIRDYTLSLKP